MKTTKTLTFRGHELRVVYHEKRYWFIGMDLGNVLFEGNYTPQGHYRHVPETEAMILPYSLGKGRHPRVYTKAGAHQLAHVCYSPYRSLFQQWLDQLDDDFNQPRNFDEELRPASLDLITELTAIRNRLNTLLEQHT